MQRLVVSNYKVGLERGWLVCLVREVVINGIVWFGSQGCVLGYLVKLGLNFSFFLGYFCNEDDN